VVLTAAWPCAGFVLVAVEAAWPVLGYVVVE